MAHALIDENLGRYRGSDLTGTALSYSGRDVKFHGPLLREYVWPGRQVIEIAGRSWPVSRPEDCRVTSGVWLDRDGNVVELPENLDEITDDDPALVLVCPGCGVDST